MNKPNDYDQVQKLTGGGLPAGGYVCRIVRVDETRSKNGREMLKVALDIDEGEYAGYYRDRFDSSLSFTPKWGCIFYQLTQDKDGNTSRGLKTFCENVKESNGMNDLPWGEGFCDGLRGKLIGVVFGREQYQRQDGQLAMSTKPRSWKTVEEIQSCKYRVPEDKLLVTDKIPATMPVGFDTISDDDVPF